MNRADLRTLVRSYLHEATADLWTDAMLNAFLSDELRSLPRKGVYLEEIHEYTTTTREDYALPTGTIKVEQVERNYGTATNPDWQEIGNWDNYVNALWFKPAPDGAWDIRIHIKKTFSDSTDDVTALDVPDDKLELITWGTVVRAYKAVVAYLMNASNWDAVAKPDGVSLLSVIGWLESAKREYKDLLNTYKTTPKPRFIDLT